MDFDDRRESPALSEAENKCRDQKLAVSHTQPVAVMGTLRSVRCGSSDCAVSIELISSSTGSCVVGCPPRRSS
jgi:hypothetical protein